jgi:hypothetical protein
MDDCSPENFGFLPLISGDGGQVRIDPNLSLLSKIIAIRWSQIAGLGAEPAGDSHDDRNRE